MCLCVTNERALLNGNLISCPIHQYKNTIILLTVWKKKAPLDLLVQKSLDVLEGEIVTLFLLLYNLQVRT